MSSMALSIYNAGNSKLGFGKDTRGKSIKSLKKLKMKRKPKYHRMLQKLEIMQTNFQNIEFENFLYH